MLTIEQENGLSKITKKIYSGAPVTILQGPAGSGKALVHGTRIPSPSGDILIEDIKVGDIIWSRKGQTTKVLAVYPQGKTENYQITFEDGRTSNCSSEHLWSCFTSKNNLKEFTAREIFEHGVFENKDKPKNGYRFKIPLNQSINYLEKALPIPPYVMGVFLGDGCTLQSKLTISSKDEEIIERVSKLLNFEYHKENSSNYNWFFTSNGQNITSHSFFKGNPKLRDYSYNKEIPSEYLLNSKENRLSLLQGLMDTDGSVDLKGRCSFSTTSEKLKEGFLKLIYSLGFSASVGIDKRSDKYTKGVCYRIHILAKEEDKLDFFQLKRKKKRIEDKIKKGNQNRRYDRLAIVKIEPIERNESTCISVDNEEKLFLTEDFIVTHNTYLLKYILEELGYHESQVAFLTFTGTAANVLIKNGVKASTIHSLIYKAIIRGGFLVGFRKRTRRELREEHDLKLLVVDEFSMLSQELLNDLMSFDIQILLVGDQYQLPPIGEPNKFANRADVFLTEVHRQALDNPILYAATRVRDGRGLPAGLYGNVLWVGRKEKADESWYRKDVQIITGLNKTKDDLNLLMAGSPKPIRGHKIIFLRNDMKNGVTNGSIAELTSVNQIFRQKYDLSAAADGLSLKNYPAEFILTGDTPSRRGQYFSYAYAISCHKAQGQTFDSPGMIYDESYAFREDSSRWLYVALTRFTGNHNVAILR